MKVSTTLICSFVRESNGEAYALEITAHIQTHNGLLVIGQGESIICIPLGDAYQFLNTIAHWFGRPDFGEEKK